MPTVKELDAKLRSTEQKLQDTKDLIKEHWDPEVKRLKAEVERLSSGSTTASAAPSPKALRKLSTSHLNRLKQLQKNLNEDLDRNIAAAEKELADGTTLP